jgi:hypothetical protein
MPPTKNTNWQFNVRKQLHFPPFKPWVAYARRYINGELYMVNGEGDTPELALKRCEERLAASDYAKIN